MMEVYLQSSLEMFPSELLEDFEEMFPGYYMHGDVILFTILYLFYTHNT